MARIVTYNVHRWLGTDRRTSPERIADVIAACGADIVALQEVHVGRARFGGLDAAALVARRLGMELHFQPTMTVFGERFGLATLTHLPARAVRAGPLLKLSRLETRCALWLEVDTQAGPLQVVNTHLGLLSRRERLAQAEALLGEGWLGDSRCTGPAVLLGDLNAGPSSSAYARLSLTLRDAQAAAPQPGSLATFPAWLPLRRIDHIFVNDAVEVLSVETLRGGAARIASDHLPLVADLHLAAAALVREAA